MAKTNEKLNIRHRFGFAPLGPAQNSRGKSQPVGSTETGTWAGTWDDTGASIRHVGINPNKAEFQIGLDPKIVVL